MTDLSKASWEKQTNPDTTEYECFFHYTDEMLYSAGFEQGCEHTQSIMHTSDEVEIAFDAGYMKAQTEHLAMIGKIYTEKEVCALLDLFAIHAWNIDNAVCEDYQSRLEWFNHYKK